MAEYIEREALLKHAHIGMTRVSDTEWQKGYWDGVDDMAEYIREQPAADVAEVKHGEWIYHECVLSYNGTISGHSCSVCRAFVHEETFDNDTFYEKYCGNCGARMDGEGE